MTKNWNVNLKGILVATRNLSRCHDNFPHFIFCVGSCFIVLMWKGPTIAERNRRFDRRAETMLHVLGRRCIVCWVSSSTFPGYVITSEEMQVWDWWQPGNCSKCGSISISSLHKRNFRLICAASKSFYDCINNTHREKLGTAPKCPWALMGLA